MIRDILSCSAPILNTPTQKFDFQDPPMNPAELANDLIETMIKYKGIGLAANQVGLPYSVFALYSEQPLVLFNPRIVDTSTETVLLEEGCLSRPNFFVKIKRPAFIRIRYTKHTGETVTEKFIGMTARCIQHELDHLNGVDYTTRANRIHYERAARQEKNRNRKLKRTLEGTVDELYKLSRALPRKLGDEIVEN